MAFIKFEAVESEDRKHGERSSGVHTSDMADEVSKKGGAEGTVPCHVYREAKDFEENK